MKYSSMAAVWVKVAGRGPSCVWRPENSSESKYFQLQFTHREVQGFPFKVPPFVLGANQIPFNLRKGGRCFCSSRRTLSFSRVPSKWYVLHAFDNTSTHHRLLWGNSKGLALGCWQCPGFKSCLLKQGRVCLITGSNPLFHKKIRRWLCPKMFTLTKVNKLELKWDPLKAVSHHQPLGFLLMITAEFKLSGQWTFQCSWNRFLQ